MAHREDGLHDIFEHDVTIRENLKANNILTSGDLIFTNDGAGLPYGSCYGNEITAVMVGGT